jgi:hypothetical protein
LLWGLRNPTPPHVRPRRIQISPICIVHDSCECAVSQPLRPVSSSPYARCSARRTSSRALTATHRSASILPSSAMAMRRAACSPTRRCRSINVSNESHVALFAYATTLNVLGKSAKFDVIVPYVWLTANGVAFGMPRQRYVKGFADPAFRFSINFIGAPALTTAEFKNYRQNFIRVLAGAERGLLRRRTHDRRWRGERRRAGRHALWRDGGAAGEPVSLRACRSRIGRAIVRVERDAGREWANQNGGSVPWCHLREADLVAKHGTSAIRPTRLLLQKWSMLNFATLLRPSGAMASCPPRMASISVQVVVVKPQVRSTPTYGGDPGVLRVPAAGSLLQYFCGTNRRFAIEATSP